MDLADRVERTRHFGAEFLTWLLYKSTLGEGAVETAEGPIEVWFEDKVKMISPLIAKEVDLFKGKTPAHSHEALEALRRGKVVEEAVLTIGKGDDREWKLSFNGPKFALSSVRLPAQRLMPPSSSPGSASGSPCPTRSCQSASRR